MYICVVQCTYIVSVMGCTVIHIVYNTCHTLQIHYMRDVNVPDGDLPDKMAVFREYLHSGGGNVTESGPVWRYATQVAL